MFGLGLGDVGVTFSLFLDFLMFFWFSLVCVLVDGWCGVPAGAC